MPSRRKGVGKPDGEGCNCAVVGEVMVGFTSKAGVARTAMILVHVIHAETIGQHLPTIASFLVLPCEENHMG